MGGSKLGSDLDMDPDPDPWKIEWIRIRQNDADPLDLDPDPWKILWIRIRKNDADPLYLDPDPAKPLIRPWVRGCIIWVSYSTVGYSCS